jgi:trehalose 6-phosphate synthase/phosphatase
LEPTTGGLVAALIPAVEAANGSWFAWNPKGKLDLSGAQDEIGHRLTLIPVSESEVAGYYRGFSNGALWPLCHYAIDRCSFQISDWRKYVAVNERFADRLTNEASPESLVWVHDYHLMLVPGLLRERGGCGRIAYFHHIPFPSPEVFRILPWQKDVLLGLLGADLVGFHTSSYARNFLEACRVLPDVRVDMDAGTVTLSGRVVRVHAFPIGIDWEEFQQFSGERRLRREAAAIRENLSVDTLVLGVDRLDYTKGIHQRLDGFDRLLAKRPRLRGRIGLLQIAVPSRADVPEYSKFKKEIDECVGRINGKYAEDGWQPVHCVYRSFSRRKLVAYYLAADVALVTPLRDGMNLVAKEFCAARSDEDGVLILSEFAGVSECLGEWSLLVNPFDTEGLADTIAAAIALPEAERSSRMRAMREAVRRYDIFDWTRDFLSHARSAPPSAVGAR